MGRAVRRKWSLCWRGWFFALTAPSRAGWCWCPCRTTATGPTKSACKHDLLAVLAWRGRRVLHAVAGQACPQLDAQRTFCAFSPNCPRLRAHNPQPLLAPAPRQVDFPSYMSAFQPRAGGGAAWRRTSLSRAPPSAIFPKILKILPTCTSPSRFQVHVGDRGVGTAPNAGLSSVCI